ncbi:hypothetical protein EPH95_00600 [Salicibibacter halophilus]|uniref:Uncharacterized protein n=1 Tax=Salicibibacter halophilus TaxID=2502791 RepID=A0A514LE61_9BACI|nr:SA1362 family protein [Salicibibacter halophilus]QDI89855.1 hypothetical protein EPH95_00600 [Salicibibacter halophilus]
MANSIRNPVIIVILGLAALGLVYQLANNPGGFFLGLVITALIAVGLYFLLTRLILPRRSGMNNNYRKALKQSKQRQKQKEATRKNNQKKKRHLKVVDGNRKK